MTYKPFNLLQEKFKLIIIQIKVNKNRHENI